MLSQRAYLHAYFAIEPKPDMPDATLTDTLPPSHHGLLASLRQDAAKLKRSRNKPGSMIGVLLTNRGMQCLLLYRLSHALWKRRVPIAPLLLTRIAQILYAVDIAYQAELGPGIVIVHGVGLVIGTQVRIEGDCCLFHGVTLGDRGSEWVGSDRPDGHPVVESGVMFGAGAKILGPVRIGHDSVIGANAVVLKNVPPYSIMAGVPARIVGTRPAARPSGTTGYGEVLM